MRGLTLKGYTLVATIFLVCLFSSFGEEGRLCFIRKIEEVLQEFDSSVEVEVLLDKKTMGLLTTTDGTLSSLVSLVDPNELPNWLLLLAKKEEASVEKIQWDDLSFEQKKELIVLVSKGKEKEFTNDRNVPGIKIRKSLNLTFTETTEFNGSVYPPGTYDVDVSSVLNQPVHYLSPQTAESFSDFEFHFRSKRSAGNTSRDTRVLLKALGIAQTHQHIHIVGKLTMRKGKEILDSVRYSDFYRRANLLAETYAIIFDKKPIFPRMGVYSGGPIIYFGVLNSKELKLVTEYFVEVAYHRQKKIGGRYKIGLIGMRGLDFYDEPGLWGLEYRSILSQSSPVRIGNILDSLQQRIQTGDFGLSDETLDRWIEKQPKLQTVGEAISLLWYNKDVNQLISEFKTREPEIVVNFEKFKKIAKARNEVKMLLHDWSNDPLFFEDLAMQDKIKSSQRKALKNLLVIDYTQPLPGIKEKIHAIMKQFLEKSGIKQQLWESLVFQ